MVGFDRQAVPVRKVGESAFGEDEREANGDDVRGISYSAEAEGC
jgi:hypothetical protein